MAMLRAALAVGAIIFGGAAIFIGAIMIISALKSGTISMTYGNEAGLISETIERTKDATRFWRYLFALGVIPVGAGAFVTRWGWRTINGR